MRNPVTFRPTKADNEALDQVAADFPSDAGSTIKLLRRALGEYTKRGSVEAILQNHERRIEALEENQAVQAIYLLKSAQ